LAIAAAAFLLAGCVLGQGATAPAGATRPARSAAPDPGPAVAAGRATPRNRRAAGDPVGEQVMTFVDSSRLIRRPGHPPEARRLVTVIRYPEGVHRPAGLVVFGHGFAVTPAYYWRLLQAWAAAGYVVAAPVFPLGNAHAPGGPDEADLVNQPRDMSFVISRVLALSAGHTGPLAGLVDPGRIAVAGQSDGAETALAVAYSTRYRDRRVKAAIILAGAEALPGTYFQAGTPPMLAAQGTGDRINQPRYSYHLFAAARPPKYLLKLFGAGHLPPYTDEQPQLSIVERVTTAFLERYLDADNGAVTTMIAAGDVRGVSALTIGH
jgi:dienelactone hydrolase